jgi:hypothetical protein
MRASVFASRHSRRFGDGRANIRRPLPDRSWRQTFGRGDWQVRDLVEGLGLGDGPIAVGVTPASYADFADLVVPELLSRVV